MKLLFSIIIFLGSFIQSNAMDIGQLRKDYINSISNSDKADELYEKLGAVKNPDALTLAYLGSVEAIKGKHAWNPVDKLSYLKQGFATINKAVAKDPNQLEVRFLRFTLQYYVPGFLGYSKNLIADKDKIVSILKKHPSDDLKVDGEILKNMVNFMIDSKKCNAQEVAVLRKALK